MAPAQPVAESAAAQGGPVQDSWDGAPTPLTADHLARYLAFIGIDAPEASTLDTLAAIQLAHLRAIPFESLNPMLDLPVSLEHDALIDKMLSGTRGGYCFEQNMLLGAALVAVGYDVELLAARVLVGLAPGEVRPRTHLVLRVTSSDASARLVDVGFGRTTLNGPLLPEPGLEQTLGGDRYRLVEHEGEWLVESARGTDGDWLALYLLNLRPVYPSDIEMANHFVATHPISHMKSRFILLRSTPAGKRSIANNVLTIDEGERQVQREITADEIEDLLREEFGIIPPAPVQHLF